MNHLLRLAVLLLGLYLTGCASISTSGNSYDLAAQSDAPGVSSSKGAGATGLNPATAFANGLRTLPSLTLNSLPVQALPPPINIWERIRRGFAMPDLDNPQVRYQEQWYASRPDYMQRMTERGSKYIFHIVEELERRNMPTELALLPFIESAFNPQAVSSARAAGMWQFMPLTGKHFDLKQNTFRDDRLDVLASTSAALDYLQLLYGMFKDWHLALAAYNWGEGNIARAIEKNKKLGLGTAYTDLKMPTETQLYVPKLQAMKNIISHPVKFNTNLPDIGNHPYFQTVDIHRDIDVALAAKLAEVSLSDFRALNPSLSKPVLLAAGTPQILLPWDNAILFQANLSSYKGSQLASWTAWVVPTTTKPAEAAKRFHMSEQELRQVNNIRGQMLIRPGSTLLVRRSSSVAQDVSNQVANNGQLQLAPQVALRKISVKARPKDSVQSIAKRYRVNPLELARWNKVAPSASFKAGASVLLYLSQSSSKSAKAKPSAKKSIKKAPPKKAPTRQSAPKKP